MRFSTILVGVALYATVSTILVSCNKEDSFIKSVPESESNARLSGVVADDPALVSKVPMIISSDFLKYGEELPAADIYARGKQDNTLPSVNFVSPSNGSTVTGNITVQATASDNVKVSLVSFSVDGSLVSSISTAPYNFSWNSATLTNGAHTLTVTAKDAAGNSKTVSIQVTGSNVSGGDIISPTVSITSPASGAAVSGTVNVTASANDNIGISSVKFSVDGTLVETRNIAPYSFSWNTSTVATGLRTLTVTATDAAGNSISNSIQVTVNTTVLPPTPLPSSVQLLTPPVADQGGEGSCVAFTVGYAARSVEKFYSSNATNYSYATNIFSPEFLYNQTKIGDCGSGTSLIKALEFMKTTGISTWQSMPYSAANGCSLLPTSTQLTEAANFKIATYSAVYKSDLIAIKNLLVNKHPLIIMVVLDGSFPLAGPGFIWKSNSGSGGFNHALTICGYDDTKHAVKVMSSWGTGWGDGGYSWIDYDFLPQTGDVGAYVINP